MDCYPPKTDRANVVELSGRVSRLIPPIPACVSRGTAGRPLWPSAGLRLKSEVVVLTWESCSKVSPEVAYNSRWCERGVSVCVCVIVGRSRLIQTSIYRSCPGDGQFSSALDEASGSLLAPDEVSPCRTSVGYSQDILTTYYTDFIQRYTEKMSEKYGIIEIAGR